MKEIWRKVKIKNYEHYRISNYGLLINTKNYRLIIGHAVSSKNRKLRYSLSNNNKTINIMAHILVLMHFKHRELNKNCGIFLDYDITNIKINNLKWATIGDAISHARRRNEILNNKKRGVYKYGGLKSKKYRSVLSVGKMKTVTLGYSATKIEAEHLYYDSYFNFYKEAPYNERLV